MKKSWCMPEYHTNTAISDVLMGMLDKIGFQSAVWCNFDEYACKIRNSSDLIKTWLDLKFCSLKSDSIRSSLIKSTQVSVKSWSSLTQVFKSHSSLTQVSVKSHSSLGQVSLKSRSSLTQVSLKSHSSLTQVHSRLVTNTIKTISDVDGHILTLQNRQ